MSKLFSRKSVAAGFSLALVAGMVGGPLAGAAVAAPPKHVQVTLTAAVPTATGSKPLGNGGFTSQQSITFTFSSTSANPTFTCSIDGKRAVACTSPTTYSNLLAGTHKLTLTANAPRLHKTTTTFTWTIDRTPPTAVTFSGVPTHPVKVSPTITFTGEAGDSFTCSIDGGTPIACSPSDTGSQNVTGNGNHSVTVVPTDAAGNVGPSATASWTIDTTAPVVVINNPPPSPTKLKTFHVTYTVSDLTAAVTCSLKLGTTPITTGSCLNTSYSVSNLADGTYTLVITATDAAGNVGSDNASWTIDSTAPEVPSLDTTPAGITNHKTGTFTFSTSVASDTFQCDVDPAGSPSFTTACTSPFSTGTLNDGVHKFFVRAVSGGTPSAAVEYRWTIDTVPPVLTVHGLPSGVTRDTSVAPDIKVTDANPTPPTCSLAGPTSGSSCGAYNNLKDGNYTMTVSETDLAGNSAPSVVATWRVDTTPPVATIAPPKVLNGPVVFAFNEPVSGTTSGLARLTVASTGKTVPATRACHSPTRVVSCTGSYRSITLTPVKPLVSGQSYRASLLGGIVHDAAGNLSAAAARSFRAVRVLAPSTVAAHYNWALVHSARAIGHSYRSEHFAGATSSWSFKGGKLVWWTRTGPTQGRAVVTVDGHRVAAVNNYAKRNHARVARTYRHLGKGAHHVRIRVLGKKGAKQGRGASVAIDAFTAGGHRTANPVLRSSWGKLGTAVRADLRGAGVTLRFRGTSFAWRTALGPSMGIARVFLDGKLMSTADNYAKRSKVVTRQLAGLKDAFHTVRLVVTGRHNRHATGSQIVVSRYSVG